MDMTNFTTARSQATLDLSLRTLFIVAEPRLNDLVKVWERIQRRVKKTGEVAPTISILPGREPVMKKNDQGIEYVAFHRVVIKIEGTPLSTRGWRVVGMIEHTPEGNLLSGFGDASIVEYKTATNGCDHCHQNRNRIVTFIVERDGERKQIGSTCLWDYCEVDPKIAASMLSWMVEADDASDVDDDTLSGFGGPIAVSLVEAIRVADRIIRTMGFHKSNSNYATKVAMGDYFFGRDERSIRLRAEVDATPETTVERAEQIIDMYANPTEDSDFANNMAVVASMDYVPRKRFGFVAYMPEGARRAEAKKIAEAEAHKAAALFTAGDTFQHQAVVTSHGQQWSDYPNNGRGGNVSVIDFQVGPTALRWYASRVLDGMAQGENVTIKGKVKKIDQKGRVLINYVKQI